MVEQGIDIGDTAIGQQAGTQLFALDTALEGVLLMEVVEQGDHFLADLLDILGIQINTAANGDNGTLLGQRSGDLIGLGGRERTKTCNVGNGCPAVAVVTDQTLNDLLGCTCALDLHAFNGTLIVAAMLEGAGIEDLAAADSLQGRVETDNETVAALGADFLFQTQLGMAAFTGLQNFAIHENDLAEDLTGTMVEMQTAVVLDLAAAVLEGAEPYIDHHGGGHAVGCGSNLASRNIFLLDTGQIDGNTLAAVGFGDILGMDLDASGAGHHARGIEHDLVALVESTFHQCTGDNGTVAAESKDTVGRQTEGTAGVLALGLLGHSGQLILQFVQTHTGEGGNSDHLGAFQEGAFDAGGDIFLDHLDPVFINGVGLGDNDDALGNIQQGEDGQMLAGLGHNALVGSDDQHSDVNAAGTGQHVLDKLFVARNVDDAGAHAVGQGQIGEAQLDGNAALLFFGQTVGVNTGQSLDEAGLAVVDVTCCTDNYMVHASSSLILRSASAIFLSSPSSRVRTSKTILSLLTRQMMKYSLRSFSSRAAADRPLTSS